MNLRRLRLSSISPYGAAMTAALVLVGGGIGAEVVGAIATGGFPVAIVAKASAMGRVREQGGPVQKLAIHFRNLDDENKYGINFKVYRKVDGRWQRAKIVDASGNCSTNGSSVHESLFTLIPFASRDCTVDYLAPGAPTEAKLRFQHWTGLLPVTPFWFGNRTSVQENALS